MPLALRVPSSRGRQLRPAQPDRAQPGRYGAEGPGRTWLGGLLPAAILLVAGFPAPGSGAATGIGTTGGPAEKAMVETLAGPRFCAGRTLLDPASGRVRSLALEPSGTIFVETGDPELGQVRVSSGTDSTLLTTGVPAGPELHARDSPSAGGPSASRLAPDGKGGFFIAASHGLLHVDPRRPSLETAAGNLGAQAPARTATEDAVPLAQAGFRGIRSIAADERHNLYIADQGGPGQAAVLIRFANLGSQPVTFYPGTDQQLVVAPGEIGSIAGGSEPGLQPVGPARRSRISGFPPSMVAIGSRLYLGLYEPPGSYPAQGGSPTTARVAVINLGGTPMTAQGVVIEPGMIATVTVGEPASRGGPFPGGLGFSYLPGIAALGEDTLLLADRDRNRILEVDREARVSLYAGGPGSGFNGNYRPAAGALLDHPYDVKVASSGEAYISDGDNDQVRVVNRSGSIRPAVGNSLAWRCVPDRSARRPAREGDRLRRGSPAGIVVDRRGGIIFSAPASGQLLRIKRVGEVAALGPAGGGQSPDLWPQAPSGLALGSSGVLYVLDSQAPRVVGLNLGSRALRVNGVEAPAGKAVTVAGDGVAGSGGDGGRALLAHLARADSSAGQGGQAVAADPGGNLFIADTQNHQVRRVDPFGTITALAGVGAAPPLANCCLRPAGVLSDPAGNLYVSDLASFQVWMLNLGAQPLLAYGLVIPPHEARAIAGTGKYPYGVPGEGPALATPLGRPTGLALDEEGNLYIADPDSSSVEELDREGQLQIVVGTGQEGFSGDGLDPRLTSLTIPSGLALDACRNLLIADSGNDRIRRLASRGPCALPPASEAGARPGAGRGDGGVLLLVAATALGGFAIMLGLRKAWARRR